MAAAAVWLILLAGCGRDPADDAIDFSPPSTGVETSTSADTTSTASTETVPEPETVPPDPTSTAPDASSTSTSGPATTATGTESTETAEAEVRFLEPSIHAEYPHAPDAFTQGLEFHDGLLLESTGLEGESSMRRVDPTTGEVLDIDPVQADFFAEGFTVVDGRINQLTWKSGTLIVRDVDTLDETDRIAYSGEGWGLCDDGTRLVMSDGSDRLTFRDRTTFEETGSVAVTFQGEAVVDLNELECVDGTVWANIWQSDVILGIDPNTGRTETVVDVSSLVPEQYVGDTNNVVNGIAHHPETGRWWLTGKRWPVMYEVSFVER